MTFGNFPPRTPKVPKWKWIVLGALALTFIYFAILTGVECG